MMIGISISTIPKGKKFFRKVAKLLKARRKMLDSDKLDWGMAEILAYGTAVKIR